MKPRTLALPLGGIIILMIGAGLAYPYFDPTTRALRACKGADQRTGIVGMEFECALDVAKKSYLKNPEKGKAFCIQLLSQGSDLNRTVASIQCKETLEGKKPEEDARNIPQTAPDIAEEAIREVAVDLEPMSALKKAQELARKKIPDAQFVRAIFERHPKEKMWSMLAILINPQNPYGEKGFIAYYNYDERVLPSSVMVKNETVLLKEQFFSDYAIPLKTKTIGVDEIKYPADSFMISMEEKGLLKEPLKFRLEGKIDSVYWQGFDYYADVVTGEILTSFQYGIKTGEIKDSDNDELQDEAEALHGTDPNNPDTDGDGLTDGTEVKTWKTNPKNPDTDGDGFVDGQEVTGGYNPKGSGKL